SIAKKVFGFCESIIFLKFSASFKVYGFGNASLKLILTFSLSAYSDSLTKSESINSRILTSLLSAAISISFINRHELSGLFFLMHGNGLQYDQWRIAGDITVNRYKTLSGADTFKLPLRPTLVILRVGGSLVCPAVT